VVSLAKSLKIPLVIFDLEHTGGRRETRGITEFAACVFDEKGGLTTYQTLINPREEAVFNPFASQKTGITAQTVKDAPPWRTVLDAFILPHSESIWIGFNSNGSDIPIMREECAKLGVDVEFPKRLDLRAAARIKTGLTATLALLRPDMALSGAHRALADVKLTLFLLESLLEQNVLTPACIANVLRGIATQEPPALKSAPPVAPETFPVAHGTQRRGHPWGQPERDWVIAEFERHGDPARVARGVGRTTIAIAYFLVNAGLISEARRVQICDSSGLEARPRAQQRHTRETG